MCRAVIGLVLLLVAPVPTHEAATRQDAPVAVAAIGPTILLLSSGGTFDADEAAVLESIRQGLAAPRTEGGVPYAIAAERLDIRAFGQREGYLPALREWMRAKYAGVPVAVIVAVGPEAVRFALSFREADHAGTPVTFAALSPEDASSLEGTAALAGVSSARDAAGTIALARALFPGTRRFIIVAGSSDEDRRSAERARAALAGAGNGLQADWLVGAPLESVVDGVRALPPDTVVLGVGFEPDEANRRVDPRQIARTVLRVANRPVFVLRSESIGSGAVGGYVLDMETSGRQAADLALRMLAGARPPAIPFAAPAATLATVDWRQLQRWDVPASRLPTGTVVLNRGQALWAGYRWGLVFAGVAAVVLCGLAAALWAERRRRAAAEVEARQQLVAASQMARSAAMGELSASVAHEINQPLGAILNNAEAARLLLAAGKDAGTVDEALVSIRDDATRAAEVVKRVRALFRKQPLKAREVNANATLQQELSLVQVAAQRRGVTIFTQLGIGLPLVAADPVYLSQVLQNLLFNALDAVEGGTPGQREVRVATRLDGDAVAFIVADNGPGIPPDRLGQVFDAFYTTKRDGVGMGLAIARTIVETHGGRLSVRNRDEGGAEFRFTIPRWKSAGSTHPSAGEG